MANGSVDLNNIYISCRYIYYDMLQCCSKDVAGGAIDLFAEKKRCKLTRIRAKYRTIHFPNGAVQCCCCIPTYVHVHGNLYTSCMDVSHRIMQLEGRG